jgi:hypothetical protein
MNKAHDALNAEHVKYIKQYELARDVNTTPEVFMELTESLYYKVRRTVARNPSTPMEVLLKLLQDKEPEIQYAALENPKVPKSARLWVEGDGYADMTLEEFMKTVGD